MRGMRFEAAPRQSRWHEITPKAERRPQVEKLNKAEFERRQELVRELVDRVAPWWEERMAQNADPSGKSKHGSLARQIANFVAYIGTQRDLLDQIVADAMEGEKYLERPMIKLMDGNEIFPSVALEGWGEHWGEVPLLNTPDVWSLGWRTKGEQLEGTEIHDHFDSEAGVHVYRGRVEETVYTFPEKAWREGEKELPLKKAVRELKEGESVPIRAPYIHLVKAHPKEPASFTIHGYFPELSGMNMFEEKDGLLVLTDTWRADEEKKKAGDDGGV